MKADLAIQEAQWVPRAAPHRHGGSTHVDVMGSWTLAAGIVGLCGAVLFGPAAAKVLLLAMLAGIGADFVVGYARGRPVVGGLSHASLTGLLLGLTLPATVPWYVPAIGAMVAVVFGKALFGGLGHFVWQPALVGRVIIQIVFWPTLSLGGDNATAPVLAPGHLLIGRLEPAVQVDMPGYTGWQRLPRPDEPALRMERPVSALRAFAEGHIPPDGDLLYTPLLRDRLPPWEDTVFGTVPGPIGATCVLALIVAGLYLIYRGFLRWQLPTAMLAAAGLAAALLPIESGGGDGWDWFPVFAVEQGRAVGVAYVLYHVTAGELMLGAFLLAGDMTTTPMRARGQIVFAAGVGVLTVFMRLYGVLEGECYWSILVMNTLVGVIDRRTKRDVLGMEPA
ncbi:MAG: hypothetical protein DCC65_11420 [Planctomycetota bacterium]|nr:MAG: hypothetical protein DCC65_11420 [Planctomycetota bacterium]